MPELYWGKARIPDKVQHAMGLDPIRLRISSILALEDFEMKCNIAKTFPLEVLTYYFVTRQISEALNKSRHELQNARDAYFADIEIPPTAYWVTSLDPEICLYNLVQREWLASVLELKYYKMKRCRK